ncbi:ATP-binding cassette sub-family G member 5 [Penicillium chrysogenum]|nr:ATP-binding cassette sub-family G member 5 [Penicillium chrysogenum]
MLSTSCGTNGSGSAVEPSLGNPFQDLEKNHTQSEYLANDSVQPFRWHDLQVKVKDRKTKAALFILTEAAAHRVAAAGATTTGDISANGQELSLQLIRDISSYVEQEDALIGSLTVREMMMFAARLSLSSSLGKQGAFRRVDDLINSFGLGSQADTIVGTPKKRSLSGGQKKRLGPSSATFRQFDKLWLLSGGKTCYFGPITDAASYFEHIGYAMSPETNSAEFFLDFINTGLDKNAEIRDRTQRVTEEWSVSTERKQLDEVIRKWLKARVMIFSTTRQPRPASAFMSFMALAYVPAFLEDLNTFQRELVGRLSFMISNSIIGLPFLFLITILFSVIEYRMSNFRPSGTGSYCCRISCCPGLVDLQRLRPRIGSDCLCKQSVDAYVFQGAMVNEFKDRVYECAKMAAGHYQCRYPSSLNSIGKIAGPDVLKQFSIETGFEKTRFGIMIGIIAGYRLFAYLALVLSK